MLKQYRYLFVTILFVENNSHSVLKNYIYHKILNMKHDYQTTKT